MLTVMSIKIKNSRGACQHKLLTKPPSETGQMLIEYAVYCIG